MPVPEANILTTAIIDCIYLSGGFAFRASSTGIFDQSKGTYRTAPKKGVADILGVYRGYFIAIEVKIGKDILSLEQDGFLKNVVHCNGYVFVAKTLPEFEAWWLSTVAAIRDLYS